MSSLDDFVSLARSLKDFYDVQGFCRFDTFVPVDQIDNLNAKIDDHDLKPSATVFDEDKIGKIKQIQYLNTYDAESQTILDRGLQIAEALTGHTDLEPINMQLFEKHPHISKPTRAHQDNAYFKMTPVTGAITLWLSLDVIDEENGCLYYAPKTHLTPTRKHSRYHNNTTFRVRSGVPGLSLCLHEHPEETDIPMRTEKGDLLAHSSNLVHRAGKNNSDKRRRAIGMVYISKSCKEDKLLTKYHDDRLREDIELQKVKDPANYRQLRQDFAYLFDDGKTE